MRTVTLEQVIPIAKIENDNILSKRGDITLAWELTLPETMTLSSEEYEAIHACWVKAIRILPQNTVIHKQDWFTECKYLDSNVREKSFLAKASDLFFFEKPYLDHKCYLFLTFKGNSARRISSALNSSLISGRISPPHTVDKNITEQFYDKAAQFIRILEDGADISCRRMVASELASTETPGLIEKYCFLLHPQESPIVRDIQLKPSLKIGTLDCQVYTLADVEDLPAICGQRITYEKYSTDKTKYPVGFTAAIGQLLPCNHIYNQYLVIENAQETIKRLEAKRLRLQSLSAYSRDNAIAREATNAFLNEAISQQRLPIKAHFNIIAWTETEERKKEVRNQIASAMAQLDARAKQEYAAAAQIYWAGIPGNAAEIPAHETFDTFADQACCFINNESNYRTSRSPMGMRLGERLTGRPLHVDLSQEPMDRQIINNNNKFVLAGSGGGKSFFCNHLVRSYYETGAHILLIDVGHSYHGLCKLLDGYYFTYEEKSPMQFNPFYTGGEPMDTEKKESLKTLLIALWKKDDESFTRAEYVSLSNAIQDYYDFLSKNSDLFACFDSFYEFLIEQFQPALKKQGISERNFDLPNMLYVLKPYYKGGEFDYLLNSRSNLEMLEQRFIVFELDNIKDHPILFPTVTLIIMEVFISKMRRLKGIKKIILIEEAWKAIAKQGMAEYIKYLFKTVRKFYGEAIVVTQDVDDIISSPVIKDAIINNADCKILLDQSKYINKFDRIQEVLGLTDKEKTMVLSLNRANDPSGKYKEIFISLGSNHPRIYRVEVSLEEYLTYTTQEKEKVQVQAYAKKYGSTERGIRMLSNRLMENQPTQ